MDTSQEHWDSCIEAGRRAYEKGCYAEAEQILKRTMDKFIANSQLAEMSFVDLLITYARVKREMNQFNDALSLYYLCLSHLGKKQKSARFLTIKILEEIALCYCLLGKFHQSREKERDVLSIVDETLGRDSREADECTIRLACLSWVMGDMDASSVYLQRHWHYCKKKCSADSESLAAPTELLAHAHYKTGNYLRAELLFKQALENLPDDIEHQPERAEVGNELGMSMCAQCRYDEARTFCKKSARIRDEMTNNKRPLTKVEKINNLADVYCARRDFHSARLLCESANALRWEAPTGNVSGCLRLYSKLLKLLSAVSATQRIDRRAQELGNNESIEGGTSIRKAAEAS